MSNSSLRLVKIDQAKPTLKGECIIVVVAIIIRSGQRQYERYYKPVLLVRLLCGNDKNRDAGQDSMEQR